MNTDAQVPERVQDGRVNNGGAREGAGRPRKYPESVRRQQQRAREAGANFLPHVMAFWMRSMLDKTLDWRRRNRAAENIANRCGLPVKAILESDAIGGMTLERLAEIFRGGLVAANIAGDPDAKVEAEDAEFTELDVPPNGNGLTH